jgi:hypothetical protein
MDNVQIFMLLSRANFLLYKLVFGQVYISMEQM